MHLKCANIKPRINGKGGIWLELKSDSGENTFNIMPRVAARVRGDPIGDLSFIMKLVAAVLITLSALNLLVDFFACLELQRHATNYDEKGMTTAAMCSMMLVLNHMVICTVHLYYATKLLNIINERSFFKFHQWYLILTPFMCVEAVVVFLFLFFPNNVFYFLIFGNMGLTLKLYMLLPIKRYMRQLRQRSFIPPSTWQN